ncbi:RNA polymerase, alpha chain C terminal domain [Jeotgalicoccus aerolatus]|uniref:RNA polymerase, alpha chain C terminal domain n=1 Tax=Jeotgalicoccus aerolatus TaxID=709510 RepID=A0A1G9ENR7_9STAP|nr:DNA-directed RNA polymerase subunit alpha C-terminal domain-containing protein [Jeotgalicoccus aerolatus]SDK77822.1 RNA polymerase, alpha chain C terminal domain [Jeotgalicoccus aerolatus]
MDDIKVSDLRLSNRSKNQLIKNGYIYAYQLKELTDEDLENIRNLGAKSIQEIQEFRDNMNSSYESNISIPKDITIEDLRDMEIEKVIDSENVEKVLKINNIKLVGTILELSYEDIKKFRNVDDQLINEIQSICKRLREKINLVDRDLFKLVLENPDKDINSIICENIPKTHSRCSIKYLFQNRFVNDINIEEHEFSNKEKKLLITYDLHNIDSLLSISYDEILNKPGISKKTLNVVLQKLLNHIVVQNKHEIFIGDISRLYLKESSYSYLLVMREKFLDRILINLNNTIDSVLNSEQFPITYKIDLLTENKFIEKSISEMEFNEIAGQEIVYSFVKNNTYIYRKNEICEKLSCHFINMDIYKHFDELVNLDLISIDELEKVYSKKRSILSYVAENYNENTLEMMKLRLDGKTLEEVGNATGVTRERVRQVVKKVTSSTNQTFKEDENAYWFCNYDIDNKQYQWMFKDNLYYYLSNRYEKGSKSWEDILNDDKASKQLKMLVRNKLLKGKIEIGNKIISKTRTSIIDYVLEEFGKDVLHIDDISEIINLFLEELGLDKEEFEIDIRYLENRLSDTSNAVSRGKKYYRYYDYDVYDWDLFYEEINFDEWKNLEISTEILFKYHPLLMESYNIKHENELHNIIRRTSENRRDLNIELSRMPNIAIGNVDREQQVKDLMYKHAPLYVDEFVNLYYETFGVKEQTVKANYLKYIDKYIVDDYIKSNFELVNEDDLKYVESILDGREFMFIEDLKELLEHDITDLQIILKHINYKTFTSYILKSEYETSVNYYNEKFYNNMVIVDLSNIDKRIWNLSSFGAWLNNKFKTMEMLEFSPKKYITSKKLNEIGLTRDILEDFRHDVLEKLSGQKVWTINTIIDVIDNEKIDSFGFEPIFYRSILRGMENIYSNKIGGNYLLKKDQDFSFSELVEEEVTKVKMIDIFDLTEIINEKYDIKFEYYKLIESIKRTTMYYDEIMEKVYLDLNYYYEEFEY